MYIHEDGYTVEDVVLKTTADIAGHVERLKSLEPGTEVMAPLDGYWISREEAIAYAESDQFRIEVELYQEMDEEDRFQIAIRD